MTTTDRGNASASRSPHRLRGQDAIHTGALLLMALVAMGALFGMVARVLSHGRAPAAVPVSPTRVAEWMELRSAGFRAGLTTARLEVVYFSDFECPGCRAMHQRLDSLDRRFPGHVAVTLLHYPIESLHPHARAAAVAYECAGDQGRFAEFTRALFGAQERIGITAWTDFAREARVADLGAFERCRSSSEALARVRQHERLAARVGVAGTPTVIVNGRRFGTPPSTSQLDSIAADVFSRSPAGAPLSEPIAEPRASTLIRRP